MHKDVKKFVQEVLNCDGFIAEVNPRAMISSSSNKLLGKAMTRSARLSLVNKPNKIWNYQVTGGDQTHTVRIRVKGEIPKMGEDADIEVTCNCPFFRWQGPEHWARVGGYEYKNPVGTASFPKIRDPDHKHPVCKHIIAALEKFRNYFLK